MGKKSYLSMEKGTIKYKKITQRLVDKVLFCSCISKNGLIQECPRLSFLDVRVVDIGQVLGQSEEFETKYNELLYKTMFPTIFS